MMYQNFKALSVSFKNTPLEIREKLALDEEMTERLLRFFKEFSSLSEILLISTCNRTEIYYSGDEITSLEIIKMLCIEKGLSNPDKLLHYFQPYHGTEAVEHLFRVALGLEAQVVGDLQITNQVKRAYQLSADYDMAGPFLHRLMHTIFFANKRVVQETAFRDGAASVSYAATELVEELTTHIINPKILVLGLGEIGADVCKNLTSARYDNVTIINRTQSKAEKVGDNCGYKIRSFDEALPAIAEADVIISSIAGNHFRIDEAYVRSLSIQGYKYFIDLSVPRCVEKKVENVPGVLVFNIDNIRNKASKALAKRVAAIPAVESIVNETLSSFKGWAREMEVSPTIHKLKDALEKIRQEEIARYLKRLNPEESKKIEKITKNILQKIIKVPVVQLKAACKRGEADNMIDAINDLFDLEKNSIKS